MDKIIYLGDAKDAVREIIYNYNGIYDNRSQYGVILDAMNRLDRIKPVPSTQLKQNEMIKEIRKWINSGNRGNADYFIVDKIEEIIDKYE